VPPFPFSEPDLLERLHAASADDIDTWPIGVVAFDATGVVRLYSRHESAFSGISRDRVMGRLWFDEVAQCMNNFLVAQRFVDARAEGSRLDTVLPYVLTLKMRPTPVRLRLLWAPGQDLAWVVLHRTAEAKGPLP